jgi:hypothetical protein
MEILVNSLVLLLVTIDRLFQRSLRSKIPDYESFKYDPAAYLARQEIVIGPFRRLGMSFLLASMLGLVFMCGLGFYRMDHPPRMGGPVPLLERLAPLAVDVGAVFIITIVLDRFLRGGNVVIRPHGIVLRRRQDSVFVPWFALRNAEDSQIIDGIWWRFWVPAENCDGILHARRGILVAHGRDVKTKQLFFRKDGRALMANLYSVRLRELAGLFTELGNSLGQYWTSLPTTGVNQRLNDEFL